MQAGHRLHSIYVAVDPDAPGEVSTEDAAAGLERFITRFKNFLAPGRDPVETCIQAAGRPALVSERSIETVTLAADVPGSTGLPQASRQHVSVFRLHGCLITCLSLDGIDCDLAGLVALLQVTTDSWDALRVDTQPLTEATAATGSTDEPPALTNGRQLLVLDGDIWPDENDLEQLVAPPEADEFIVRDMTFPVPTPTDSDPLPDPGQGRDGLAAVASGSDITVLAGHTAPLERWGIWSSLVLTAARCQLGELRHTAHSLHRDIVLGTPTTTVVTDATRLKVRLSLVKAGLEIAALVPPPLADCHRRAATTMGLPHAAETTAQMLTSLTQQAATTPPT